MPCDFGWNRIIRQHSEEKIKATDFGQLPIFFPIINAGIPIVAGHNSRFIR